MIPFPVIDPIALTIPLPGVGGLPIRWYALAYIAGFICASWWAKKLTKTHPAYRLDEDKIDAFFVWAIISVIIGGRLGFVLFYNLPFYVNHPMEILKTWQGGMSFHGGFIGVILATLLFCWKNKLHPADLGDRIAAGACIGLFFGRIANFINGELWGKATAVNWAMIFPHDPTQLPRHPSQLYEAGLEGILLFIVLYLVTRKGIHRWQPTGVFLIGYGLSRFAVEYVREPDTYAYLGTFGFSTGQLLSIPMVLVGMYCLHLSKKSTA